MQISAFSVCAGRFVILFGVLRLRYAALSLSSQNL